MCVSVCLIKQGATVCHITCILVKVQAVCVGIQHCTTLSVRMNIATPDSFKIHWL